MATQGTVLAGFRNLVGGAKVDARQEAGAREVALACDADGLLSGGVQSLADLASARTVPEIVGAIVGRALYDGAFTIEQARAACDGVAPS